MVGIVKEVQLSPFKRIAQQFNTQQLDLWRTRLIKNKARIVVALIMITVTFAWLRPSQFIGLWLTKDQQGQILFMLEKYDLASHTYSDTRWRAFSAYGAEDFKQSALLYGQFSTKEDKLHRANAVAHAKEYVKARSMYQAIVQQYPEYEAAQHNLAIVVKIIEDINLMSESQKPEQGDSIKELGDEPQRADGAEKEEAREQEIEQLNAEQLLLDPELNEMWLRQVQKNPGRFLGIKFQMQYDASSTLSNDEAQGNENE